MTPATPAELAATLSFALRYLGRRRVRGISTEEADGTAAYLVTKLLAEYVVVKRPAMVAPSSTPHMRDEA